MTEEQKEAHLVAMLRLQNSGRPVEISVDPVIAFSVVAALQLAMRHPRMSPITRHLVLRFTMALIESMARADEQLRPGLMCGFDPSHDE